MLNVVDYGYYDCAPCYEPMARIATAMAGKFAELEGSVGSFQMRGPCWEERKAVMFCIVCSNLKSISWTISSEHTSLLSLEQAGDPISKRGDALLPSE